MNYIKHLTGFFEKIKHDDEVNPSVISVYIAIFQIWNQNRFSPSIYATRDEIMRASKISSTATYHKCIKILEEKEYIVYSPSFSSYTRTSIQILPLDDFLKPKAKRIQNSNNKISKNEKENKQPLEQGREQPLEPLYSIYNNKHIKTENKHSKQSIKNLFDHTSTQKSEQENDISDSENCHPELVISSGVERRDTKKKLREKKGSKTDTMPSLSSRAESRDEKQIPPHWDRVFEFFVSKSSTRLEAEKFYNYFQSNGWLVGGKTKMKDWHAAARNWILNSQNFKSKGFRHPEPVEGLRPNHLNTNENKNYAEPL